MGARTLKSTKPSGASSLSPREGWEFFIERSLGSRIVAARLRAAGCVVHTHAEFFKPDAPDTEWLEAVGCKGWIVLSKDDRIRYRPLEKKALIESGVRAFILTGKGGTGEEMAGSLLHALPAILHLCGSASPPFIAHITKGGQVNRMA